MGSFDEWRAALQRELCDLEPGEADYDLHGMPSFCGLAMTLMLRNFRNIVRNPAVLWLRFLMYMGLSGMIGTVWWQAGDEPLAGEIANIAGVLFFIATFMAFMSISVLPAFLEDKAIFVKDRANGAYGVGPYSLAGMLISLPFIFLLSVAAGSICYFCLGLNPGNGRFFLFIMNLFVSVIVDKFNEQIKKRQGSADFTDNQKEWVKLMRLLMMCSPKMIPVEPINCFRL